MSAKVPCDDIKIPSLDELRKAIPAECFKKDTFKAFTFLVFDIIVIAFLYKVYPFFAMFSIPGLVFWYFVIGMELASIFVVGHDCGHGTFSDKVWINDLVGNLTHGFLFCPFWSWQKSHRLHHTFTSHVQKDRGHAWITEKTFKSYTPTQETLVYNFGTNFLKWYAYTTAGVPDGSHFWPFSSMFSNNTERIKCVVSDLCCFFFAYMAWLYIGSFEGYIKFYVLPLIFQGFWIVMITYLQHQTDDIRVYEDGTWNFVKGSLQTIDRPYGWFIDELMHHITDGHVAHHLFFTQIPHYHLMEATSALQSVLEPLGVYRKQASYNFIFRYAEIAGRLKYLVGEGTGLLTYPSDKRE